MSLNIVIHPRKLGGVLLAILAGLVALDLLLVLLEFGFSLAIPDPIVRRLDSNNERSLPTLFNVELLFLAALTCALTVYTRPPRVWVWRLLVGVFVFLAIDEAISIHEGVGPRVRELLGTSGMLHVGWVIPYGLACIALLWVVRKWLLALPPRTLRGFLVAALLYGTGAMFLDALSGAVPSAFGLRHELFHAIVTAAEEGLEMLGLIVFVTCVLEYAGARAPILGIRLVSGPE